jgi:predicted nucleic acid-binding protein
MPVYFDACSLVKAYIPEVGSEFVVEMLADSDFHDERFSSSLVYVETAGALTKAWRAHRITKRAMEEAFELLAWDWSAMSVFDWPQEIYARAASLITKNPGRGIGGIDFMHFEAARALERLMVPTPVYFVTSDRRLADFARSHMPVINPDEADFADLKANHRSWRVPPPPE